MQTIEEAAKDYASRQWGDYPLKAQERIITKEDFKAGVKFAETWIPVEQEMPEDNEYFIEPREDEFEAEETIKVLVMTDQGDITDNRRIKKAVGKKEWVWFMGYDGDAQVVKWRPLNVL
jgi:hypothetical protein